MSDLNLNLFGDWIFAASFQEGLITAGLQRNALKKKKEKKQKNAQCALACDAAELWSDARTVMWRIPLVLWPQKWPLFTGNVTWARVEEDQKEAVRANLVALLHMTSRGFWGKDAPKQTHPAD